LKTRTIPDSTSNSVLNSVHNSVTNTVLFEAVVIENEEKEFSAQKTRRLSLDDQVQLFFTESSEKDLYILGRGYYIAGHKQRTVQ